MCYIERMWESAIFNQTVGQIVEFEIPMICNIIKAYSSNWY